MNIIILNRKVISYASIALGIMLVILSAQLTYNSRIRSTALMQNGISKLKQYSTNDKKYEYKLPDNWSTKEVSLNSSEIPYHNDFSYADMRMHGFVEVWNLKTPVKTFLENSKNSSYIPGSVSSYKIKKIKIEKYEAYLVTYNMKNTSGEIFKAWEYYIQQNNEFFRICFYVPQNEYKINMPVVFESVANTFHKA